MRSLNVVWLLLSLLLATGCAGSGNCPACNTPRGGASWSPAQLAFFSPLQAVPAEWDIYGLSLGALYSRNAHVTGVEVCFYPKTCATRGISIGLGGDIGFRPSGWAIQHCAVEGIQFNGLGSTVKEMFGGQVCGFYAMTEKLYGMQFSPACVATQGGAGAQVGAFVSLAGDTYRGYAPPSQGAENKHLGKRLSGIQISGLYNNAELAMKGLQFSILNSAHCLDGMQIGFFNDVQDGNGVQIGLFNAVKAGNVVQIGLLNRSDGPIPLTVLLNVCWRSGESAPEPAPKVPPGSGPGSAPSF